MKRQRLAKLLLLLALASAQALWALEPWQVGPAAPAAESAQPPNLYGRVLDSAGRVEGHAHDLMPGGRIWFFDRERDRQHLQALRTAAHDLEQNQAAFAGSLSGQQAAKFDSELHRLQQLQAQLVFRIESLDHELQKRQPQKWQLAADADAIPKLLKEWRKIDRKIAQAIGMAG